MDELAQSLEAFGPWDWACVGANLLVALLGIPALRCWHRLPSNHVANPLSPGDAAVGAITGFLSFGIINGLVSQQVAQSFSSHFEIYQAHVFTAAICGQLSAAACMLSMGALSPTTIDWAPDSSGEATTSAGSRFLQALRALSLPRILLGLLAIFALGFAAMLVWKGFHHVWEQFFLRGWAGQPPADAPQEVVDAVLKADVDNWRFVTIVSVVTLGAPVMEELAFRGMIYPGLRRLCAAASERHARALAVCLVGALFSAAHQSPSAALPLFAFGAFMCLLRDRYGLLTCMAVHACFNGWNLVWLKLAPAASTL